MNNNNKFMELAFEEAEKALDKEEVPIGAVVVFQGKVVGRGHNQKETKQDPTAHAEMIALKKAARKLESWRMPDCEVYVTLEPCPMCIGAMLQARIKKLVFGAFDEKGGAVGSLYNLADDDRLNHRIKVVSGVEAKRSSRMLKEFFNKLRANM